MTNDTLKRARSVYDTLTVFESAKVAGTETALWRAAMLDLHLVIYSLELSAKAGEPDGMLDLLRMEGM